MTNSIPVGGGPSGVDVNSRTNKIYVANVNNNTISVIDGTKNTVTDTIVVGRGPSGVDVSVVVDQIVVANREDDTISAITQTLKPTA